MAILLSYKNARGETAILDDTERRFIWENYGRTGTEAPTLEYTEVTYADGSTEIIAINMQPRECTFNFTVPMDKRKPALREKFEALKQQLIQTGAREGDWGQLMIRRPDGRELFLNCAYTGGLDEFIREYPLVGQFSLTFRAQDALFYDGFEQTYTIQQDDRAGYLFMDPALFMDPSLYMMSAQGNTGSDLYINGDLIYPKIIINGPAENISLINKTTGRKIILSSSVSLEMNERITITTEKRNRTIKMRDKNGVTTNLMSKLTSASSLNWWLTRGTNNIEFKNTATTPESYLQFRYKEGYLSAE